MIIVVNLLGCITFTQSIQPLRFLIKLTSVLFSVCWINKLSSGYAYHVIKCSAITIKSSDNADNSMRLSFAFSHSPAYTTVFIINTLTTSVLQPSHAQSVVPQSRLFFPSKQDIIHWLYAVSVPPNSLWLHSLSVPSNAHISPPTWYTIASVSFTTHYRFDHIQPLYTHHSINLIHQ